MTNTDSTTVNLFSGTNKVLIILTQEEPGLSSKKFIDQVRELRELAKKLAEEKGGIYLNILTIKSSPVPKIGFYDVFSLIELIFVLFSENSGKELAFQLFGKINSALAE